MRLYRRPAPATALLALLLALCAPPGRAASYLPLSDAELARRAPVIVRAQVIGQETRIEVEGAREYVCTLTTFRVVELLKGSMPGATFQLELLGGEIGGLRTFFPGTPDFSASDEVILFLSPNRWHAADYALTELGLSHFDVVADSQGRRFAARPAFNPAQDDRVSDRRVSPAPRKEIAAPDASTPDETARPLRDADSFLDALRAIGSSGEFVPIDYAAPQGLLAKGSSEHPRPLWVNIGGAEPGDCGGQSCLFRWYWDTHQSPNGIVTVTGNQSHLSDGTDGHADVAAMVAQWTGVPTATVLYSTGSGGNVSVMLDVANQGTAWTTPLACNTSGVVGYGGTRSSPQASNPTFKGDSPYFAVPGGDLWIRQQTGTGGCFPASLFKADALHEMGHTLGLGHPDQDASRHSTLCGSPPGNSNCPAVMNSVLLGFNTPQPDDIAGIQWYYGPFVAPLAAQFTLSPAAPAFNQAVQFSDASTGGPFSWSWDFDDHTTSNLQNPTHVFADGGEFDVTLTVTGPSGTSTVTHVLIVSTCPAGTPSPCLSNGKSRGRDAGNHRHTRVVPSH